MHFYKMVASGNDFIVVDNRRQRVTDPVSFARGVCERHSGIGADGVLLIENVRAKFPPKILADPACKVADIAPKGWINPAPANKIDYRVRILNADGSEAEACGNGFRCVARLTHERFDFPAKQRFESLAGVIDAEVKGPRVRVRLVDPRDYGERQKIEAGGRDIHYYFIRVGVPHVVIFVQGLEKIQVAKIGREVRFHNRFKPAGTNVNFAEVTGPNSIQVETYERGVEENTQACGTGSAASALVGARIGYLRPPVQVKTRSGEILTVDFGMKGNRIRDVYLEGEAKLVYEGKIIV